MSDVKILVVYYSMTGNVAQLAKAVAEGAQRAGAEVRIRQVAELMPEEELRKRPVLLGIKDQYKHIPLASNADLEWADGVAFGSPTRYGNMTAQLKEFIDQTGKLWLAGTLTGKLASVFTSTATQHGGQESTLISMMVPLFHLGFIIQGFPYVEQSQMSMEGIHGGSPYGISSVSGPMAQRPPTKLDLDMAAALGKRLAENAAKLRKPSEKARAA